MHARIPLDVDLEDKLIYGLTPTHLAYIVVGLLAGFATWSEHWTPTPVRAVLGLMIAAIGASAAWGRWRGRALDGWAIDIAIFMTSNYRVKVRRPWR